MDRGTGEERGGGAERTLLIQQIRQGSVKYFIRVGGQQRPPGPDGVDLTGRDGGAGGGHVTHRQASGKDADVADVEYFSSTRWRSSKPGLETQSRHGFNKSFPHTKQETAALPALMAPPSPRAQPQEVAFGSGMN